MYQKERLDQILQIVKRNGYVTVKFLVESLHYSNATINRDLNILEKQKQIKRTYGGVEYVEMQGTPLKFRYLKMRSAKLKIAKMASEFVRDGDMIFMDSSTTTEYMAEFLSTKKNLTVVSNNMTLLGKLSEYGITAICLGGRVVEPPSMLGGEVMLENIMKYRVDRCFFSSGYCSEDGMLNSAFMHKLMAQNSRKAYYLVDGGKLDLSRRAKSFGMSFSDLFCVISDHEFSEEVKKKYPDTQFVKV